MFLFLIKMYQECVQRICIARKNLEQFSLKTRDSSVSYQGAKPDVTMPPCMALVV